MTQDPGAGARLTQAGELRSSRLESVRALAALAVLMGHVYGSAHAYNPFETLATFKERLVFGGGFGVYVFFALSGYLLFWPFARRDFGPGDRIDLGRYAINRAVRILPLYYVSVIVVLVLAEHGSNAATWARFLTWTENFSVHTVGKINGVLWSLVVELHFYILLPLLALLLARVARGSRARGAAVLLALGAASLILRLAIVDTPTAPSPLWRYSLPTTFFFFVAGMLLALLRLEWEERPPGRLAGAAGRTDVWLLATIPLWVLIIRRYDWDPLAAAAGFLTVGACVLPLRPGPLVRALEWRPLAVVGIASYSLYIWHVPILHAITGDTKPSYGFLALAAFAVPLCVAVALASYAVIEAPFLRLRRRWAQSSPAPG